MVPDRQKCRRTDEMDGQTDGRRQNYIPPTSSGDKNAVCSKAVVLLLLTFCFLLLPLWEGVVCSL